MAQLLEDLFWFAVLPFEVPLDAFDRSRRPFVWLLNVLAESLDVRDDSEDAELDTDDATVAAAAANLELVCCSRGDDCGEPASNDGDWTCFGPTRGDWGAVRGVVSPAKLAAGFACCAAARVELPMWFM